MCMHNKNFSMQREFSHFSFYSDVHETNIIKSNLGKKKSHFHDHCMTQCSYTYSYIGGCYYISSRELAKLVATVSSFFRAKNYFV